MMERNVLLKFSTKFLNTTNIKRYSRSTSLGAVFGEPFNRTMKSILKEQVFEKGNADWLSELSSVIEK